jgi:hypothetical protein
MVKAFPIGQSATIPANWPTALTESVSEGMHGPR